MKRSPGFSLLEVLIGTTLLGIVAFALFRFQAQTYRQVRIVEDMSVLSRAMVTIERDIMKDMIYIPPQDEDSPDRDSPIFMDEEKSGVRCYDKTGAQLGCELFETNAGIYFRARFYKVRVADQTLDPASPLNRIPVSRVRFRIEYKVANQQQPPMLFARLSTDALRY